MPVTSPPFGVGPWASPTLAGSWENFGGGYATMQYRKDTSGLVTIKGCVKTGSGILFTLPVGYRPAESKRFACCGGLAGTPVSGQVDIGSSGSVTPVLGDNTTLFAVDEVSFLAA